MQARPSTHAGAVALLVFAAEYWERHDVENYPDIPAAMVTAARAIAGESRHFRRAGCRLEGWLFLIVKPRDAAYRRARAER
jgi:hypothetical protein